MHTGPEELGFHHVCHETTIKLQLWVLNHCIIIRIILL